jgi:hypothetical protein
MRNNGFPAKFATLLVLSWTGINAQETGKKERENYG